MLVNWPYTIVVIMPTNHGLMNTLPGAAVAETRRMIGRWAFFMPGAVVSARRQHRSSCGLSDKALRDRTAPFAKITCQTAGNLIKRALAVRQSASGNPEFF